MNVKSATFIALVGAWIGFILSAVQFSLAYEHYLRLGIQQITLSTLAILFNHIPIIIFLTFLHKKQ